MGTEETALLQGAAATPLDQAAASPVPQVVCDLLYLCGRTLAGETADPERVLRMDLGTVHALAASHSLTALAYYGVESALDSAPPIKASSKHVQPADSGSGATQDDDLLVAWRADRDRAIRSQMLFAAERAQVCAWLAEQGIWHAPLKGAVLESLYPQVGMREYCDNDILYDESRREDVARFFKERGYRINAGGHGAGVDDAFTKEPIYQFEMHRRLFSDYASPPVARYYQDVRAKLAGADGSCYSLRFSDEDCYVYLIAHAHKHFFSGGTGVRILCDLKVLPARKGGSFDWGYVEGELNALGMAEFGNALARLAASVFESDFDPAGLCEGDVGVLYALVAYGTYGTLEHWAELKVGREQGQDASAGGYVAKRLFPDASWWQAYFPFAYRHKWARPAVLVYRSLRAAAAPRRRRRVAAEVKALFGRFGRK